MFEALAQKILASVLDESKGAHSHRHLAHGRPPQRRVRAKAHTDIVRSDPDSWRGAKANLRTAAGRQYATVKKKFQKDLESAVLGYLRAKNAGKNPSSREMIFRSKAAFDEAYLASYRLGLKAAGVPTIDATAKSRRQGPAADRFDRQWLASSLRDERKYWNAFLKDVVSGAIEGKRFSPEERVAMYAASLDHVYDVARVVGHPQHSLIFWRTSPEKETCVVCTYLEENSPYVKASLPGVPRDGNTCHGLTRCGCQLRIVTGDEAKWRRLNQSAPATRARHLRKIKQFAREKHSHRRK